MTSVSGCQLPCVPGLSEGLAQTERLSLLRKFKLWLAVPWNYQVKPWLKHFYRLYANLTVSSKLEQQEVGQKSSTAERAFGKQQNVSAGDWVMVKPEGEILAMLDPFKETRGCAFLDEMYPYCGTKQRVLKSMERFLDERDYKVKKVSGIFLLENVICQGTPAFGKCDRCCYLFWRGEWLEKIPDS